MKVFKINKNPDSRLQTLIITLKAIIMLGKFDSNHVRNKFIDRVERELKA